MNKLERAVVEAILKEEAEPLLSILPTLWVSKRIDNKTALDIRFGSSGHHEQKHINEHKRQTLGKTLFAQVSGLKYGLGFILYVDNGTPTSLEMYSHGNEEIPTKVEDFELSFD